MTDRNERIERAKELGKQWNKEVDKDTLDAAKKGAKSDYVGQWKRTPKLPKYPPAASP